MIASGGGYTDFTTPVEGLVGTRFWAKYGCDSNGENCLIGDQVPAIGSECPPDGCTPAIDSLFEATFGRNFSCGNY